MSNYYGTAKYSAIQMTKDCQSQAETIEKALANIREAIELFLETLTDEERFEALGQQILTTGIEVHA
jgi:predicted RNase H-like HicB family nuclease